MIGAYLLFGVPSETVFPAVLAFRIVGFWLPILPGLIAYFQLRRLAGQVAGRRRPEALYFRK